MKNYTAITTFILVGLTDDPNLKILLFNFLFLTYLLSVVGNLIIITLTLKVWKPGLIEMDENTNVQILALILSSDFGRIFLPLFTVLSLKRRE